MTTTRPRGRAGLRLTGIRAAVDFARERGARAVEAYPMITEPGVEIVWGETPVGTRGIFDATGMAEVHLLGCGRS